MNTVLAWAEAPPDEISRRFHNLLLSDFALHALLWRLHDLFASPAPFGSGVYAHHDGLRPLNRRTT